MKEENEEAEENKGPPEPPEEYSVFIKMHKFGV